MKIKDAKYVDVNGIRTRYFEAGAGEPVVLIHGGSYGFYATAMDWGTVFDELAESFRVVAFDKIGQGYTDNPRSDSDYYIASTFDHAYEFVRALGLKSVHVAGHSRGAYPAARLALEHPDLVRSLIIVDSGTMMWTHNTWYGGVEREAAKISDLRERLKYTLAANCYSREHVTGEWIDDVVAVYNLPKCQEASAKHASIFSEFEDDLGRWQADFHGRVKAGDLKAPVFIIWGYNDPSSPLQTVGLRVMDLFFPNVPDTQMHVLNRAGHYCYRDQPNEFVQAVAGFARSLS